ncbi:MAG: transcription termination/antitermination protein NusG [Lachnospiraceae bacterium]|jgi:transcriptional antiterminator NusG|nr:transcription termination/antitermination protein NusG [Lachnospiraceae bacterium]
MADASWYVVHTYSGYENKVKMDIEKTIENRALQEQILEVSVPMQEVMETKNGVEKQVDKKLFPGYVLIHMIMNDDTWYVVRNTRGVTGFVGPGSKPVPLSQDEMDNLGFRARQVLVEFKVGDTIEVVTGAWMGTIGKVTAVNENKRTVTIFVEMFGRETAVELGFKEVKKM